MMTGNLTSIARPYAMAAFEHALEINALPEWDEFLQTAAIVAQDPLIIRFMGSPEVTRFQLGQLFCDVLTTSLNDEKKNFIRQLADHKRLAVLPAIAEQFKQLRAEHDKQVTVDVSSAVPLSEQQTERLTKALTKRLKLKIALKCTVNPELLGGAIIRTGDKVIDGSVRGKLNRLIEFI